MNSTQSTRNRYRTTVLIMVFTASILATLSPLRGLSAQEKGQAQRPWEATEVWKPEPPVVTPGPSSSTPPPSDAIVLFDGKSIDQWVSTKDNMPAQWPVEDGAMVVNKKSGNIQTKRKFKDYQLHLEYRIPEQITGTGQGRGNSGIFLASTGAGDSGFELQVLDSYNNKTYVNGMAGSIYKQAIPLANPCRKPCQWQSYDVVWTAPRFQADGALASPAYVTVIFNSVLVQNHFPLQGETVFIGKPAYKPYDAAPIKLQAHGDDSPPISFRNIWVRELKAATNEPFRPD